MTYNVASASAASKTSFSPTSIASKANEALRALSSKIQAFFSDSMQANLVDDAPNSAASGQTYELARRTTAGATGLKSVKFIAGSFFHPIAKASSTLKTNLIGLMLIAIRHASSISSSKNPITGVRMINTSPFPFLPEAVKKAGSRFLPEALPPPSA